MKIQKTKELAAVFKESKKPRIASRQHANAQLRPILETAAAVQQQIAVYRQGLLAAEMAADDPDTVRGGLEMFHQTLGALDTDCKTIIDAARRMSLGLSQYERYANDFEALIEKQNGN